MVAAKGVIIFFWVLSSPNMSRRLEFFHTIGRPSGCRSQTLFPPPQWKTIPLPLGFLRVGIIYFLSLCFNCGVAFLVFSIFLFHMICYPTPGPPLPPLSLSSSFHTYRSEVDFPLQFASPLFKPFLIGLGSPVYLVLYPRTHGSVFSSLSLEPELSIFFLTHDPGNPWILSSPTVQIGFLIHHFCPVFVSLLPPCCRIRRYSLLLELFAGR